jgi:hypothetical protein
MPEDQVGKKPKSRPKCTEECKKLRRIRARASYRLFRELYDFLKGSPNPTDVLRKMYDILDARWSFGSERNAVYAAESLELVAKDNEEVVSEQERPANNESETTAKALGTAPEKCVGNFIFGKCLADVRCRHGHETRLFNIGRGHFVACDGCRTYLHVGSNLMSSWRQEDKEVWRRNNDSVEGYGLVD